MTITLTRRNILAGLLVSIAAPAVIRTPGLVMPIRDRRWIKMSTHLLFNPSGEGIREFYGDPVYDGPETSLEDSDQAILDVVNRSRAPNYPATDGSREITEWIRADSQRKQDAAVREILALRKVAAEAV